jgi:hypothetical protein
MRPREPADRIPKAEIRLRLPAKRNPHGTRHFGSPDGHQHERSGGSARELLKGGPTGTIAAVVERRRCCETSRRRGVPQLLNERYDHEWNSKKSSHVL